MGELQASGRIFLRRMTSRLLGPAMVVALLVTVACVVVFSTNTETDAVLRETESANNYFSLLEDDQNEGNAAKSRSHLTKGEVEAAKKEASAATDEAAKSAETVKALRSQVNKFPSIVRHAAKTSAEDSASVVKAAADVMFKRKIKKEERRIVVAQRKTAHYERVARADLTVAAKEKADAQKALHIAASLTPGKHVKKSTLVQLASAGCQTKDLRNGCGEWSDKCQSSRWAAYMAKNCARTCKVTCKDLQSPTQEALRAADILSSLDGPHPVEDDDDLEGVTFKSVVRDEGNKASAAGKTAYKTARHHSEVTEKHTLHQHVANIPQANLKQTKAAAKAALKKSAAKKAVAAKAKAKAAGVHKPKKHGYYVHLPKKKKKAAPKGLAKAAKKAAKKAGAKVTKAIKKKWKKKAAKKAAKALHKAVKKASLHRLDAKELYLKHKKKFASHKKHLTPRSMPLTRPKLPTKEASTVCRHIWRKSRRTLRTGLPRLKSLRRRHARM